MAFTQDLDPETLRGAFGRFPSGIAALCAGDGETRTGIVASSFTVGVSMEPALVMFAVQNTSTTWPQLRRFERIGVSILGAGHDRVCRQIASTTGDRFAGLGTHTAHNGALFLREAALWLDCSVDKEIPAGDHHVVLLQVHGIDADAAHDPLVFHGSAFRQLASVAP